MPSQLAEQWVLVTGASSGFGAAAACAFGAEGANLLLGARRVDRLATVAAASRRAGAPVALFFALDVSQTDSVEAFVAWARDQIVQNAKREGAEPLLFRRQVGGRGGGAPGVEFEVDPGGVVSQYLRKPSQLRPGFES